MFDLQKIHLGITPTGWTNDDDPTIGAHIPFEQCVSEMSLAGYEGCSIGHKFPTDIAVLKKELGLRNLHISEPWTSTYFVVEPTGTQTIANFRERIDFIQGVAGSDPAIKADMVIAELSYAVHQLPLEPLTNRHEFTEAQWTKLVAGLQTLATIAKTKGMKLCYHHHVGTGIQQSSEIDRLMEKTRNFSDPLYLLFDTGHLYYAEELTREGEGQKQVEAIVTKYADRIKHVHLKNIRPNILKKAKEEKWSFLQAMREGVFTVPGDKAGVIHFDPVFKALADKNYEGWLIVEAEQDPRKANPLEYAQMAHKYLVERTKHFSTANAITTR